MQPTLALPPPRLALPAGAPALLERALDVTLAEIRYSDGVLLDQSAATKSGVFVYRTQSAGAGEELWNDAAKAWQPAPPDPAAMTPAPFTYKTGDPAPWRAVVIAAGQKDAAGQDRYAKADPSHFPRYRVRAFVTARRDGDEYVALSAPSTDWLFASAAENARFGVALGAGETAQNATSARMQIKSAALAPAAYVEIRTAGGNAVEIACDTGGGVLARVLLRADGAIVLTPRPGQRVVIDGAVETGEILYQPSGGGAKRWLP
jgi:hypothetical protein